MSSVSIRRGRNYSEEGSGRKDEKREISGESDEERKEGDERYFSDTCASLPSAVCKMMCYMGHVKIDLPVGN